MGKVKAFFIPEINEQHDAHTRIRVWWPNRPHAPVIRPAPMDTKQSTANAQAALSKSENL